MTQSDSPSWIVLAQVEYSEGEPEVFSLPMALSGRDGSRGEAALRGAIARLRSDVAGMLRSFHYAASTPLLGRMPGIRPEDYAALEPWARFWYGWTSAALLGAYLEVASEGDYLPESLEDMSLLLDVFMLEKAVYELGYELVNRPAWVSVPLRGLLALIGEGQ